jgi:hypothetical protein
MTSLDLRMKLDFLRRETVECEVQPWLDEQRRRKEAQRLRTSAYLDRIQMEIYLESCGDR